MAAGKDYTVLLRSDGQVVTAGLPLGDSAGDRAIYDSAPELPEGLEYIQVAAANYFVVLLRSDGCANAFVPQDDPDDRVNGWGACFIPELPDGLEYVQAAAGSFHIALLRSDGQVLMGNCDYSAGKDEHIPELPEGLKYVQIAAGDYITALLRSDGKVFVHSHEDEGEWNLSNQIPALPDGLEYVQVSAGFHCILLLRSDGQVVSVGGNALNDDCAIPKLPDAVKYTHVSCGKGYSCSRDRETLASHTVLLCSDGQVLAVGTNDHGQCNIPKLPEGLQYTQISAGGAHTVLVRSDGQVIAVGKNDQGQCQIPECPEGLAYVPCRRHGNTLVVQLVAGKQSGEELELACIGLSGEVLATLIVFPAKEYGIDLSKKLVAEFGSGVRLDVVLPASRRFCPKDYGTSMIELL